MLATEAAGKEGKEKEGAKLRISKVALTGAPNGFVFHKVELLSLLGPGQTQALQVDYALTEFLVPHPKEIAQGENQ
jgi:hypothetical protein